MKKPSFILKTAFFILMIFFIFSCAMDEKEEDNYEQYMSFSCSFNHHPPISISLHWSNITADEYKIYRSINTSDNYRELLFTGNNRYTDKDISYNTQYFYKIIALNNGKIKKEEITSCITPKEPDGLSADNGIWLTKEYLDYSFPEGVNSLWFRLHSSDGKAIRTMDRNFSIPSYSHFIYDYTSDIVVSIFTYYQNELVIITIDGIYQDKKDKDYIYAYDWAGTYYVLVEPKNNDEANKGTFAICFQ